MLNTAKNLLLVYLLLKPFYLFGSGGLQIADGFLLLAFVVYFTASFLTNKGKAEMAEVFRGQRFFIVFVIATFLVNGAYFLIYPEFKFLLSSLYFVFNLVAIIVFAAFLNDKRFLSRVAIVFKFNLLLQLGLWGVGLGRFYSPDRYMGTLNDPNQFGYYVFLSLIFIFVIDIHLRKKYTFIFYALALFLILLSGSTGMLLGVAVFSILITLYFIKQQLQSPYKLLQRILRTLVLVLLLVAPLYLIFLGVVNGAEATPSAPAEESSVLKRVEEKTDKASGDADISILEDRGLDTVTQYPQYIFLGAGEGAFLRFVKVTNNYGSEIHSTAPAILFYYGLFPFILLAIWVWRNVRGVGAMYAVAYVALFAVSFTLLNQRQALFWILIVMAGELFSQTTIKKKEPVQ